VPRGRPLSLDKLDGSSSADMHRPRLRSRCDCLSYSPKTRTAVIHGSGSSRLSARYLPFAWVPKRTPTAAIAALAAHRNQPARFFECNYASNWIDRPMPSVTTAEKEPGILDTPHNHPSMHPAAPSAGTLLPFSAGPRPSTPSTYAPSHPYITRSAATCAGLRENTIYEEGGLWALDRETPLGTGCDK
jgi:hypothetical protein